MNKKIFFLIMSFMIMISLTAKTNEDYIVRTFIDEEGRQIDEVIVPGRPPEDHREPAVELPDPNTSETINILSNVPAFDWVYGCSATSAAMIAGYYDNNGFQNMYAGPTNGGDVPMTNSVWGYGECPLSATHQGYDGLSSRGHVDDYWDDFGSNVDPYYGNWTQHSYEDCTADFMGTNQFHNWQNTDGSTTFYYSSSGNPLYNYTACEPSQKDGCHGFRQFIESRGYTIQTNGNFSQYIYGHNGNTNGFTFAQFKTEIDAGRPVMIHIAGHTMVGFGYDDSGNTIYIHDTWDHSDHTMTWGGSYSGSQHYGVSVFQIEPVPAPENLAVTKYGLATWNAPVSEIFISYKIYLDGSWITNTNALSYQLSGLNSGTNYQLEITAKYTTGESDPIADNFTFYDLVPPSNVTITPNGDDIDLSWSAVPGADQYLIYRSSQVDINYNFIGATATEFYCDQNAGLENKYFYKIKTYFSD